MSVTMMKHSEASLSGRDIMAEIARELDRLASSVEALQVAISPLVLKGVGSDTNSYAALQELDYTFQALSNLASVQELLSNHAPAHWDVDRGNIAQRVTLSELAARLVKNESAFRVSNGDMEEF